MKPFLVGALLLGLAGAALAAGPVRIGSKRFTESYVLGEIAKRVLESQRLAAEHKQGMGGTVVLWQALTTGAIDAYPDYTGTVAQEILRAQERPTVASLRAALAPMGIGITEELGFNNTYALVMRRSRADALGVHKIGDLRAHPELVLGLTHEFLERQDGWKPLSAYCRLAMRDVRGVDHALGYSALVNGTIDVKDAYSTDAKIAEYDLVALEDDAGFFPRYGAVFLYRLGLDPRAVSALRGLEGTLDETRMTRLNAEAERTKDYRAAAALYFGNTAPPTTAGETLGRIARATGRHLWLTGVSLLLAVLVGVPLGIVASRPGALGHVILSATGVIQTIPSLALLALLVPWLGINASTAIVALFLYSLLPIVRNTATGLQEIPAPLRESASALGLEPLARLRKIYLPLASPNILAGIKTSAVINIGTATLAALIGAGGLGELIISGLSLNDRTTILEGAVPAALLALVVQGAFDLLDRAVIPRGLRLRAAAGR